MGNIEETEAQILTYVAAGYANDEIGRKLGLRMTVVIEKLAAIMDKLSASDRYAAALAALKQGYILLEDVQNTPRPEA
jgi:DNA-binding NarL/FixJ family response regulator